jgi:DNA-binding NarL/FixJ family response regulator
MRGQVYLSREIARRAFQKSLEILPQNRPQQNTVHIETLSDREMHVFQLLGSGLSAKKIAEVLNLSLKTIESHRENINHKLGLSRGPELIESANKWVEEILLANQKEPAHCGREKENGAGSRCHHDSRKESLEFF